MTTDEVLAILAERGLRVEAGSSGPKLVGPAAMATPALRKVLAIHRAAIIQRLTGAETPAAETAPQAIEQAEQDADGFEVEYLWRFGHRHRQDAFSPPPVGAWWWRMGEGEWQEVAGRPVVGQPPTAGEEQSNEQNA